MPNPKQYDERYIAMRHRLYQLKDKYPRITNRRLREILQQYFGEYADEGRVQALCISYNNRRRYK